MSDPRSDPQIPGVAYARTRSRVVLESAARCILDSNRRLTLTNKALIDTNDRERSVCGVGFWLYRTWNAAGLRT